MLAVLLFLRGHESFDSLLPQVLEVSLRAISAVRQNFFRFLSGLFLDGLDQWRHLLFIVGGGRDRLSYNELKVRLDRDLRVVALHESIRPLQHP